MMKGGMGLKDHLEAVETFLGSMKPELPKEGAEITLHRAMLHVKACELLLQIGQMKEVGKEMKVK